MKTYILLFVYATPKIYIRDYLSLEPSETDFLGKVPIYPSFVSGFSYRTKLFFFFHYTYKEIIPIQLFFFLLSIPNTVENMQNVHTASSS